MTLLQFASVLATVVLLLIVLAMATGHLVVVI
ncbi:hypothetical protein LCGC14_2742510 [marine sediment metagenome]|uniref:Uncharacterized protein n=1 Tax=marine sediment metagenome TaxID=412755 RepID=A0A0F8ZR82_9ZZZZ